jgi:hypothetical protein
MRLERRLLGGREHAFLNQQSAEFDAVLVVDMEQGDGDAADRREADQVCPWPFARRQTSRVSAASMGGSRIGAGFKLDAERAAGLRFQDGKQGGRLGEGVHLLLLGRRQGVILIPHGQSCMRALSRSLT